MAEENEQLLEGSSEGGDAESSRRVHLNK